VLVTEVIIRFNVGPITECVIPCSSIDASFLLDMFLRSMYLTAVLSGVTLGRIGEDG